MSLTLLHKPFFHIQYNEKSYDIDTSLESFFIATLNGFRCKTESKMFAEFSNAFMFSDYFGGNWAALDECLNDLDWLPSEGFLLVIKAPEEINNTDNQMFSTLLKLLKSTSVEWAQGRSYDDFPTKPKPFHIIFQTSNSFLLLEDVLSKLDIDFDIF